MSRRTLTAVAMTGMACLMTVWLAAAQQTSKPMQGHNMSAMTTDMKMTKAEKIASASAAAPSSISAKATILGWPEKEGGAPTVLRPGTNGWSCLPDMPQSKGNDPMCVDDVWMKWLDAYLAHKTPEVTRVGIGYMLAPGGGWASNSDPYGMSEMPDNHWGLHGPHVMILVPDAKTLSGISTDPRNGGPYVMYSGTPYAHIMAPTPSGGMMMGKSR